MILKIIEFLSKTFGVGKDAVANILVTIFTFSAGILITILFKSVARILDRRNHRELFKLNLMTLIKGTFKQASAYEELHKQLDIKHMGAFNFSPKSIPAIGIFYQLGYRNLYNAYFNGLWNNFSFNRKKRRIAFNDVWATLEFLNMFHKKSFDEVQELFVQNAEANELRNKALGKVNEIVEGIRLTLHRESVDQSLGFYFTSIEKIMLTLKNQKDHTNALIINDFFVQPLLQLNRQSVDILKEFGRILKPVELNSALQECSLRYANQKSIIDTYHDQFEYLSNSYFSNFNRMKSSYRVLC